MDQLAHQACRNNNEKLIVVEKEVPLPGGNVEQFKILLKGQRNPECEEFTMVKWNGTAFELVLLNLLDEYEKKGLSCAILDSKTMKVGMSFKPHKKVENIYQVIYVK